MLAKVDGARLAQLAREREAWERKQRLGYPAAKAKLRDIKAAEERCLQGERTPVRTRVIRFASEITETRIERFQVQHTRTPFRWWR